MLPDKYWLINSRVKALKKRKYDKEYRANNLERIRERDRIRDKTRKRKRWENPRYWVMIDGEGVTTGKPFQSVNLDSPTCVFTGDKHAYTTLCYYDKKGKGAKVVNSDGLSTKECLEFILSIPREAKIAAYGFGYDITKILEDLPAEAQYRLIHPETRKTKVRYKGKQIVRYHPVVYDVYAVDLFNTRLRVGRVSVENGKRRVKEWRTIHDIMKFYQSKFVKACENWSIGTEEGREKMAAMKAERRNLIRFSQQEIEEYSQKECEYGAELAERLEDAHIAAGADLRGQFYGAGSTAKAFLRKWKIKNQIPSKFPAEVELAAAAAFFGGHFEISLRGIVTEDVYDWDISSAYPYQIYHLPCLLCGNWTETVDIERIRESTTAIVRYRLKSPKKGTPRWGPFPFRDKDGSIPYPITSEGGWVYKDEFFAGLKLFPDQIELIGALVYETNCNHKPFEKVPGIYLERLRIGKEGAGIVLKLGLNAIAGSIMQTIGSRPYYCSVWAGMITSGTRAQLLELMSQFENLSDVIMVATDGLWSLKSTTPPKPMYTGTDIDVEDITTKKVTRKPLGGWEKNILDGGVFLARPGIYFPLDKKHKKELKARGIGTSTLYDHKDKILAHYKEYGASLPYQVGDDAPYDVIINRKKPNGVDRFIGIRGAVYRVAGTVSSTGECNWLYRTKVGYGLWSLQSRIIDFHAMPKRLEGDGRHLVSRVMPNGQLSALYDRAIFQKEEIQKEENNAGDHDDDQGDYILD